MKKINIFFFCSQIFVFLSDNIRQCGPSRCRGLHSVAMQVSLMPYVLYGIMTPIIGPFRAWKPPNPYHQQHSRPMRANPRHSSTNESGPHCLAENHFNVKEVSRHKRKCLEKSIKVLNFNDARKLSQSDHRQSRILLNTFRPEPNAVTENHKILFFKGAETG